MPYYFKTYGHLKIGTGFFSGYTWYSCYAFSILL